jgi:hypothetical protein
MKKGAGVIRHLSSRFVLYSSIISTSASHPDTFSDFIFLVYSLSYRENRQNGGLTAFTRIDSVFPVGERACRATRRCVEPGIYELVGADEQDVSRPRTASKQLSSVCDRIARK